MTDLLAPFTLRGRTFRNRLWVPAMCLYSVEARDGVPTDFHLAHYGARVAGGYGLVVSEATAVVPEGRITPYDAGLWSDAQGAAWARIAALAHRLGGAFGVQLAHAGRKASTWPGWPGQPSGAVAVEEGGWRTVAPSATAFPGLPAPHALTIEEIGAVVRAFASAARRAAEADVDVVEVHAAHGYLLHQFLSPLSNQRTDRYGGSLENRLRLPLEVAEAVRAGWPDDRPLFVRLSATDWLPGGWDLDQSCVLARELAARGVDLIDVSSGGLLPAPIDPVPGYQVPFARRLRAEGVPTAAVGLITDPAHAAAIVAAGDADAVLMGREALRNPSLPLHLAAERGDVTWVPPQYRRAWPG
nr:NADH:flavin oxidoreductase/NADH oxidase [Propionibacterium sp.]